MLNARDSRVLTSRIPRELVPIANVGAGVDPSDVARLGH